MNKETETEVFAKMCDAILALTAANEKLYNIAAQYAAADEIADLEITAEV